MAMHHYFLLIPRPTLLLKGILYKIAVLEMKVNNVYLSVCVGFAWQGFGSDGGRATGVDSARSC